MPDTNQFVTLTAAERPLFVGIDVGGTSIKIGLVDDRGRTLDYHSVPTEDERGAEDAARRIAGGVAYILQKIGATKTDVARVGLATPGPMDTAKGLLLTPGNLPTWWNFPIRDRVAELCGLPVRFANDATAAAFGEFWCGAGRDVHSMVMLTLGTGIGGGIVISDMLVEGAHCCGGECGHMLIDPRDEARRDSLGQTGSLEAHCGSYGVVSRAEESLDAGRTSTLSKLRAVGHKLTPLHIAEAAEAGDNLALEVVLDTARFLALGIVTLIHMIDPESVVLGGAMNFGGAESPLGKAFLQRVMDEVRSRLLPPLRESLRIDFGLLGVAAGYIGAAGLARLEHINWSAPGNCSWNGMQLVADSAQTTPSTVRAT